MGVVEIRILEMDDKMLNMG